MLHIISIKKITCYDMLVFERLSAAGPLIREITCYERLVSGSLGATAYMVSGK